MTLMTIGLYSEPEGPVHSLPFCIDGHTADQARCR
jgi:hypothetical protein